MRPGRPDDVPSLAQLWRREVVEGRQDTALSESRLRRLLARFDWEMRSRVVDEVGCVAGSPQRAYDIYRKLGFEVSFEADVWEATSP